MTPEEYLVNVPDMTVEAMRRADNAQERMMERNAPEPTRIQCAHCNGYYGEDEVDRKPLCYKCKENLDDYQRILGQRNLFLSAIEAIRTTADLETIHGMCDGILGQYKEEKP
jgi:Zn finger protein HypA/HybF involved in hydrogenase expression